MRSSSRKSGRRGLVLVITLLAMVLLGAMVFFVFNLGRNIHERTATQHAADATAISGATFAARSFNLIAMNNVGMTRTLTHTVLLDAMPETIAFTMIDQASLLEGIDEQLGRRIGRDYLIEEIESIRDQLQTEVDWLVAVDDQLATRYAITNPLPRDFELPGSAAEEGELDVRELTHFIAPNVGLGQMWRAMLAMDEANQAIQDELAAVTYSTAVQTGRANGMIADAGSTEVHLVWPADRVPVERGDFLDFQRPFNVGQLPDGADDPLIRRGPFDTVFGLRRPLIESQTRDNTDNGSRGSGGNDWSEGAPEELGRIIYRNTVGYGTHGLYEELRNRTSWSLWRALRLSRISTHFWRGVEPKRLMLWQQEYDEDELVQPNWIMNYQDALAQADADDDAIVETRYVRLTFRYERDSPADTRVAVDRDVLYRGGWVSQPPEPSDLVAQHIWVDDSYEWYNTNDPDRVFVYENYFIFAGINIGEPVTLRNPYEGLAGNELPAPMDFAHHLFEPNETGRQALSMLAVARRENKPTIWREMFARSGPEPNMVAVAQAKVFNNHSWDLWTQMWHAKLEPVQSYERWVDELERSIITVESMPNSAGAATVTSMHRYLNSMRGLAREAGWE